MAQTRWGRSNMLNVPNGEESMSADVTAAVFSADICFPHGANLGGHLHLHVSTRQYGPWGGGGGGG